MCEKNKKVKVKFDPPIKPRFLPGEVDQKTARIDFQSYKIHRIYCHNIKAVVDNKPPKFSIDTYYDRVALDQNARLAKSNYEENLKLAKKINKIFRMGGKVDCWNLKYKKHKIDQNEIKRQFKEIEKQNRCLYRKIHSLTSEYSPEVFAKQWKILKAKIEEKQRYPWFKQVSKYPSITENAIVSSDDQNKHRPKYFFDLELANSKLPLGRIVFELYTDFVPLTCANFEAFCKGYNGVSYRGTPFHRIITGHWCQGGDVTKFNGTGGASIYEAAAPDKNPTLQYNCPGVLSTYIETDSPCDSKFNLTFGPLKTVNENTIVFGKIVKGIQNLYKIEEYGTKFGNPLQKVIISNCGQLQLKNKDSKRQSNQSKTSGLQKTINKSNIRTNKCK